MTQLGPDPIITHTGSYWTQGVGPVGVDRIVGGELALGRDQHNTPALWRVSDGAVWQTHIGFTEFSPLALKGPIHPGWQTQEGAA